MSKNFEVFELDLIDREMIAVVVEATGGNVDEIDWEAEAAIIERNRQLIAAAFVPAMMRKFS